MKATQCHMSMASGSVILTEAECDREDGDWIENLRGGPVDILKNAYTAFRAKDGGQSKCSSP